MAPALVAAGGLLLLLWGEFIAWRALRARHEHRERRRVDRLHRDYAEALRGLDDGGDLGRRLAAIATLAYLTASVAPLAAPAEEALCGFLRRRQGGPEPAPDAEAAVLALRRRRGTEPLDLRRANLAGADFTDASVEGWRFDGADLRDATFAGARLRGAVFADADLRGCRFRGGEGSGDATGTTAEQIGAAARTQGALLPPGLGLSRPALPMPAATSGEPAIITRELTKSYGDRVAVSSLDLEVRRGEVFGFLGPNGAGKTTTIRMLVGLVRPSGGRIEILGRDLSRWGRSVLPRVGALIESPGFHPSLSGRDNLRLFAHATGGLPPVELDRVLDLVDLRQRQHDRVRSYSLGMRQRLGVAIALLHQPELLLLDEPSNGLDPAGVVEMRDLLRRLAAEGRTVFVSSHALAEVQQSCDRVAIIDRGRLVELSPIADLVGDRGAFEIELENAEAALKLIHAQPWGAEARVEEGLLVTTSPTGRGRELLEFLREAGFHPDRVDHRRQSLETIFLELTGARESVS